MAKFNVLLFLFISVLWTLGVGSESMDLKVDEVDLQEPHIIYPHKVF